MSTTAQYAWIIDTDDIGGEPSAIGKSGPRNAPDELTSRLARGEGEHFELYDDDYELYYTGRLVAIDDELDDEEACSGPLLDFGMPNAGCTYVRYPGRPELDCG